MHKIHETLATNFVSQFELNLNDIKRWNTSVKCDYFFATQYKQSFVYFGAAASSGATEGTTTVIQKKDESRYIMHGHGCSATFVDGVAAEHSYIWSTIPQIEVPGLILTKPHDDTIYIYGGYASREKIKMFGETMIRNKCLSQLLVRRRFVQNPLSNAKCWTITLTSGPSQCTHWSEDKSRKSAYHLPPLIAIQHCCKYDVYCYKNILFIIDNNDESLSCSFLVNEFNKHVKCVIINDNIYIVNGNKMAKIQNVKSLLSTTTDPPTKPTVIIDFLIDIPRINSTPFVIKETLFIVGGCDEDSEPFSEIYQFVPERQEWKCVGRSVISRYGASAVVVTDKNNQQAVFIAGGFKGEGMPCSVIEQIPVITEDSKIRGKKRNVTEAALD